MEKVIYDNNSYFVGQNGIYLEMQNIKEFIDEDGIKRFVIELKDNNKILHIENIMSKKKEKTELIFEDEKNKIDFPDLKNLQYNYLNSKKVASKNGMKLNRQINYGNKLMDLFQINKADWEHSNPV